MKRYKLLKDLPGIKAGAVLSTGGAWGNLYIDNEYTLDQAPTGLKKSPKNTSGGGRSFMVITIGLPRIWG